LTDYSKYKSWPFNEARKVVKRLEKSKSKEKIIFQTGYGPSGLPHIGTFGEVLRSNMVRFCFEKMTGLPTELVAFSDDMDGFRKVPDNVPNKEKLSQYIDYPLTSVPDPFEQFDSFGEYNNKKLVEFLNRFNLPFTFQSSTAAYKSGLFNETIKKILFHNDEILNVVLPTLGEERRKTYSPFFPINEDTGKILQVAVEEINTEDFTISYYEEGKIKTKSVLDGNCKLQWKVDWAMRWAAFEVDYEMCGKDLTDSYALSSKICKIIGSNPPENLIYELFLDENAEKISKSKGNGISIDDWLKYSIEESLSMFMYQRPYHCQKIIF
jgi:lysyl-tRNA synthetase class 1